MTERTVIDELQSIAKNNGGMLRATDVVDAARSKNSPLHDRFTWDDTKAAHEFRLEQARHLIRTTIQYIEVDGRNKSFRVFCNLSTDRANGDGYREVSAVLKNKKLRDQLIADAYAEMKAFQERYAKIKQLSGVIREIRKVLAAETEKIVA